MASGWEDLEDWVYKKWISYADWRANRHFVWPTEFKKEGKVGITFETIELWVPYIEPKRKDDMRPDTGRRPSMYFAKGSLVRHREYRPNERLGLGMVLVAGSGDEAVVCRFSGYDYNSAKDSHSYPARDLRPIGVIERDLEEEMSKPPAKQIGPGNYDTQAKYYPEEAIVSEGERQQILEVMNQKI